MHHGPIFPREVVADIPRVTLVGNESLWIEQHHGLVGYQPEEVALRTSSGLLRVTGGGLRFRMYSSQEAMLCGRIDSVSFEERREKA